MALKSLRSCVFIWGSVLTSVTSGYILRFVFDWNHSHRMTPSSFGIFFCNDHKKLLPPLLLLTGSGSVATPKLSLYITQLINSLRLFLYFLPCFIWFYCKSFISNVALRFFKTSNFDSTSFHIPQRWSWCWRECLERCSLPLIPLTAVLLSQGSSSSEATDCSTLGSLTPNPPATLPCCSSFCWLCRTCLSEWNTSNR